MKFHPLFDVSHSPAITISFLAAWNFRPKNFLSQHSALLGEEVMTPLPLLYGDLVSQCLERLDIFEANQGENLFPGDDSKTRKMFDTRMIRVE
jgi:hypothetical protein